MKDVPAIEVTVTINGQEAFGLFKNDMCLAPGDEQRALVISALVEALITLTGPRPRAEPDFSVRVCNPTPAPVLKLVRPE